jgi:hypothetical protein
VVEAAITLDFLARRDGASLPRGVNKKVRRLLRHILSLEVFSQEA